MNSEFGLKTNPGRVFRILGKGPVVEGTFVVETWEPIFSRWVTHCVMSAASITQHRVELEGPKETIILDQFVGPTPLELQRAPLGWSEFKEAVEHGEYETQFNKPRIVTVDDKFVLDIATTAYREKDGRVEIWRAKWDSSG